MSAFVGHSQPRYGSLDRFDRVHSVGRNADNVGPADNGDAEPKQSEEDADDEKPEVWERNVLHASVLETYAICSAILTSFCVCTILINHDDVDHYMKSDPIRYVALLGHQIIVRICTAMGVYSMLIFMLSALYEKTALARATYGEGLFNYFKRETQYQRMMAFKAMYYACLLYMISLALGFFYSVHAIVAGLSAITVLAILGYVVKHTSFIMGVAGVIFMKDPEMLDILQKAGIECNP